MTYKLYNDTRGNAAGVLLIEATATKAIPFVESNTDYQAYLKWLEDGNTPEPADQQGAE